jgi:DNA gyrase inhibitor GyrI
MQIKQGWQRTGRGRETCLSKIWRKNMKIMFWWLSWIKILLNNQMLQEQRAVLEQVLNTKREDHEWEHLVKLASDVTQIRDQAKLGSQCCRGRGTCLSKIWRKNIKRMFWWLSGIKILSYSRMLQERRDKLEQVLNTKCEDHEWEHLVKLASDTTQNADQARLAEDWQGRRDVIEQDLEKNVKRMFWWLSRIKILLNNQMLQEQRDKLEQVLNTKREDHEWEHMVKLALDTTQNADQAKLGSRCCRGRGACLSKIWRKNVKRMFWWLSGINILSYNQMLQEQRDRLEQALNTKHEDHEREHLGKLASDAAQNAD